MIYIHSSPIQKVRRCALHFVLKGLRFLPSHAVVKPSLLTKNISDLEAGGKCLLNMNYMRNYIFRNIRRELSLFQIYASG